MYSLGDKQRDYLVLSDLHLGDGKVLEDFFREQEFALLLERYIAEVTQRGRGLELVLNGDIIDFLQIEPLGEHCIKSAVTKLCASINAHKNFFEAIKRLLAQGHWVTFLKGNHDFDLILHDTWGFLASELCSGIQDANQRLKLSHTRTLPGIWIEHGHQYDPANRIDYSYPLKAEDGQQDQLRLPWGSRFVIDPFNAIEAEYGFIDKIKGIKCALLVGLVVDFKRTYRAIKEISGITKIRDLAQFALDFGDTYFGAKGTSNLIEYDEKKDVLMSITEVVPEITILDSQLDPDELETSPSAKSVTNEVLLRAKLRIFLKAKSLYEKNQLDIPDILCAGAENLSRAHKPQNIIMGHTHSEKDLILPSGARYINTGTWAPRFILPNLRNTADLHDWLVSIYAKTAKHEYEYRLNYAHISYASEASDSVKVNLNDFGQERVQTK